MGDDSGHRPNQRQGAARKGGRPHAASPDQAAPGDLRAFTKRVRSAQGRVNLVALIAHRALDQADPPAETEQRNLALALRAIKVADELKRAADLPRQMTALAAQLEADREDRARMESGVEFANEGAQIPPSGGNECH